MLHCDPCTVKIPGAWQRTKNTPRGELNIVHTNQYVLGYSGNEVISGLAICKCSTHQPGNTIYPISK